MNNVSEFGVTRTLEEGICPSQFFECLPVACYACDRAGAITAYNRRAVELWGRAPQAADRFTGALKVLDAQGHLLGPEATVTSFLLRSGLAHLSKELTIERPDGSRVTVLSNAALLHDEEGKTIGALDVLQDITNRRWLEDARRVGERVNASVRVATEVAQLKPALLAMVSLLDLLGSDSTLSVQARSYAALTRAELMRFEALVKHMAHLSGAA